MGNLSAFKELTGWNCNEPKDIIFATDGSVLSGVGYHSWIIETETEDILLSGGGHDNGLKNLMNSYRS
jgi:hypothetical protein